MNKNIILILTLIFLGNKISFAQVDSIPIPFVTYWSIGDEFKYRITKEKKKWKEDELTKHDSSSYEATLMVIDSTSNGYTIKWIYETNLSSNYNIPAELMYKFSKYELTEVEYKISEVGEFLGVENWKEVAGIMDSMMVDIIDVLSQESPEIKEDLAKAMTPMRNMYSSKQGIESYILKELHYLHYPFGIEYQKGKLLEYEDSLPNLFGGDPIRGEVDLYVDSVDYDDEFCVLIQEMELNEDDTKRMLTDLFKQMSLGDKEVVKMMETSVVEINDYNKFAYYYYPGIPVFIETRRTTNMDIDNEAARGLDMTRIEWID